MNKAREDLEDILNLLAEWRRENNIGYVAMHILADGGAMAYTIPEGCEDRIEVLADYEPIKTTAGDGATTVNET